ncbi:MAG: hypothetical protein WAK40_08655 [Thermoplasmata archaeon]
MTQSTALEVRLEAYASGEFSESLAAAIGAALASRWPAEWDVKLPPRPSLTHPAEWRAVVPLSEGSTPNALHSEVVAVVIALDPTRSVRFRTRWSFQESPNHQEVYEERWSPGSA